MRCSLVSNKIIQARERLGLTQQQLAEKLCVTNKAVSKWECGVTLPDISLLVPLCRVLGLTVQELLDEYDGKFGNTPGCQTTEDPAQDTLFAAQRWTGKASANACTLPMNTAFPVATQTKLMYVITRTTACGGVTNVSLR